jgi:hypothetical protein
MTHDQATAALVELTWCWQATPRTSNEQLADARRMLALALLADQMEPIIQDRGPLPDASDSPLLNLCQLAVTEAALELGLGAPPPWKAFARSIPILTHHDPASIPAWAAGRARAKTAGPFTGFGGFDFWVDSYEPVSYIQVSRAAGGPPFLLIPAESDAPGAEQSELVSGTVWIRASEFAVDAPDGYVGLRTLGGFLRLDGPIEDPQVSFILTLDFDPPAQAEPGATRAKLPGRVTIRLAPGGMELEEISDASLDLSAGTFVFTRSDAPPRYERELNSILIPLESQPARLNSGDPESPLYTVAGSAAVSSGAWMLPITEAGPDSLGEASGAGSLALVLGPGLTATWRDLAGGPARLKTAFVEASPGLLAVIAPGAETRHSRHHFLLWHEARNSRRSSLEAAFEKPHTIKLLSSHEGIDAVLASASVAAHFDQPLYADGSRPAFRAANATMRILEDPSGTRLQVSATAFPRPGGVTRPARMLPLALANAVLRTTSAQALLLSGRITQQSSVSAGIVVLGYGLYGLLPILPDPYASNTDVLRLDTGRAPPAALFASLIWSDSGLPKLAVSAAPVPGQEITDLRDLLPPPVSQAPPRPDDPNTERLRAIFDQTLGMAARETLVLLDVSTNANQLGVGMGFQSRRVQAPPEIVIRDLVLAAPSRNLRVFMLPQVQWEPVVTPPNPAAPFPEKLFSLHDGGPAFIGTNSVNLVPIAPLPVAADLLQTVRNPEQSGAALFTLPFGIKAVVQIITERLGPFDFIEMVRLYSSRVEFGSLVGARQFTLEPGRVLKSQGAPLPGAAIQTRNAIDRLGPQHGYHSRHLQ